MSSQNYRWRRPYQVTFSVLGFIILLFEHMLGFLLKLTFSIACSCILSLTFLIQKLTANDMGMAFWR